MGRGRAKAKQTKVARRLKYYSPETDLSALERELKGSDDDLSSSGQSASQEEQDDYIAEHYGRNGRGEAESQHWSGDDEEQERVSPARDRDGTPAPNPGSWMKKRA